MTNKIEQVARAIVANRCLGDPSTELKENGVPITVEKYVDIVWKLYAGQARAAIEAMRKPTEGMVKRGGDALDITWGFPDPHGDVARGQAKDCHNAMIDAALGDE